VDVTGDYLVFDALEPVTYTARGVRTVADDGIVSEAGEVATAVPNALRRLATEKDVERSGGEVRLGDLQWSLPVAELADQPHQEDEILDTAGVVWTVVFVEVATFASRWRVFAR
jgi:hypothetical protein